MGCLEKKSSYYSSILQKKCIEISELQSLLTCATQKELVSAETMTPLTNL